MENKDFDNELDFVIDDSFNETETSKTVKKADNKKVLKILIPIISAVLIIAVAAFFVFKYLIKKWNNGDIATPAFLANTTLFDDNFTYFDSVYVNGVALNGLTVQEAEAEVFKKSQNYIKEFNITVKASDKKFKYTQDDFEFSFNEDEVLAQAKQYCMDVRSGKLKKDARKEFAVTPEVTEKSIESVVKKIAKKINKSAINSTFKVNKSNGSFSYTKGENGKKLNSDDLIKQITAFINSEKQKGTITAKVKTLKPEISSNELEENITLISSFSTISTNSAAGNNNMRVSLAACNGSIIEPGEVWSFNGCTGNSNLTSLGYQPATVISGGQLATGVGGGLCQSSTTIYNAALYANMEIVERRNHYWTSTYCKEGFDASIDYGIVDLKLKNNTDYPMYLECYMNGNKLSANIYGRKSTEFDDIKLTAERTAYVSGEYFSVASYRTLYKDGKQIKTESLGSSRYSLKPKETTNENSSSKASSKKTSSKTNTSSNKTSSKSTSSKKTSSKSTSSKKTSSIKPVSPSAPSSVSQPTSSVASDDIT